MDLCFLNENRRILVNLLSAAIRGKDFHATDISGIDWQEVFNEAILHQVLSLVYPLISKISGNIGVPKELFEKWRRYTLNEGLEQERNYIGIGNVLSRFSNVGIPVIALKGLVLRELYPYPSLRTMGDIDILVKPKDVDRAGKVLLEAGYTISSGKLKHTEYSHQNLPDIELHRSMIANDRLGDTLDFETEVWDRAVTVNINGVTLLSLYPQNQILYLAMHMASHILSSGFGLRQLSDFVLLIEHYGSKIDWDELFSTAELYHIDSFLKVLLETCNFLLDMELPHRYQEHSKQNILLVQRFIEDIFNGGVFGENCIERVTANRLLYYNGGIMNMLLPKAELLDTRFHYARSHHFLLPLAWIHRIFHCFVRRDITFMEKTAAFTSSIPVQIFKNRKTMLKQLGLLD